MQTSDEVIPLSVIVTIFRPSRGLSNLTKWLCDDSSLKLEVILVHDNSDEESFNLPLEGNIQIDKFIFVEGNFGSPGASRNAGLQRATREWITFWDFDDLPSLESVMELMVKLSRGDYQAGIGSFQIVSVESGQLISQKVFPSEIVEENLNLTLVNPGIWRWIFRREAIGDTRFRNYQIGEDQLFLAEIGIHNSKIAISQSVTYSYFLGDPSQQTSKRENFSNLNSLVADFISLHNRASGASRLFIQVAILILARKSLKLDRSLANLTSVFRLILTLRPFLTEAISGVWRVRRILQVSALDHSFMIETKRVEFFGGLGNQLFQLALALTLNRAHKVSLINPSPSIMRLVSQIESMPVNESCSHRRLEIVQSSSIRENKIRNFMIRVSSSRNSRSIIGFKSLKSIFEFLAGLLSNSSNGWLNARGLGYDGSLIPRSIGRNCRIVGYVQTFAWAESIKEILLQSIRELVNSNSDLKNLILQAEVEQPIFVHCRMGDYKYNPKIGLTSDLFFSQAIAHLSQFNKSRKVWLFSDQPENAISRLSEVLGQHVTVIGQQFSDIETLSLLTYGDTLIISNSTFGWWGAFLSDAKVVMVPEPWFRRINEPNKLLPQNWIRIDQDKRKDR